MMDRYVFLVMVGLFILGWIAGASAICPAAR